MSRFLNESEACASLAGRVVHDGKDLIWVKAPRHCLNGELVGKLDPRGYRRLNLHAYGSIQVHRAAFFLAHGYLPEIVDHIDGNPTNNAISNLRAATPTQNSINCKTPKSNTSGRKGVYWNKGSGKWQASIRTGGKLRHLGLFADFDEAVAVREQAEKEHFGDYARCRAPSNNSPVGAKEQE